MPAVFGQFFGPGGRMDSYYTSYLQPHVLRGPDGLEPSPDSPIGQSLSPAALSQFDRAQAIRLAFFASGSPQPNVEMYTTKPTRPISCNGPMALKYCKTSNMLPLTKSPVVRVVTNTLSRIYHMGDAPKNIGLNIQRYWRNCRCQQYYGSGCA